jgi:hypothetical protein
VRLIDGDKLFFAGRDGAAVGSGLRMKGFAEEVE